MNRMSVQSLLDYLALNEGWRPIRKYRTEARAEYIGGLLRARDRDVRTLVLRGVLFAQVIS